MADQVDLNQLLKDYTINFGKDFVEDLKDIRKVYSNTLRESFEKISKEHPGNENLLDELSTEVSNVTFQMILRVIYPMWKIIESNEREIKFLRQK